MLRLLAQREQGYEDIGALMGLSVEEVRAKVKEALEELNESGQSVEEAQVAEKPAVRQAEKPVAVDETPAETVKPPPPPPPPRVAKRSSPLSGLAEKLPSDRPRLAAMAVGVVVVVVLIVLLATGAFSSGGGSSESASSGSTTPSSSRLTQAVLTPVNGGDAQGRALFGRVRNTAVLQVAARGLDPSPQGQSYTVWLYRSPKLVLRIGAVKVGKSGGLAADFPIPTQVLAYVAGGAFNQVDISLTPDAAYKAEVAQAKKQNRLPRHTGTDVLRGEITGPAIKAQAGPG